MFDNISAREKYQFVLIKKRKKRPPNKLVSFHAKNHKISKKMGGKNSNKMGGENCGEVC